MPSRMTMGTSACLTMPGYCAGPGERSGPCASANAGVSASAHAVAVKIHRTVRTEASSQTWSGGREASGAVRRARRSVQRGGQAAAVLARHRALDPELVQDTDDRLAQQILAVGVLRDGVDQALQARLRALLVEGGEG